MIVELDSKFLTIKKKFFGKESIVLIDLKEISKIDETLIYKDLRIITSNGKVFKIYGGIAPKNPINFKLASNVLPNRVGLYILKAKLNKLLENSLSK